MAGSVASQQPGPGQAVRAVWLRRAGAAVLAPQKGGPWGSALPHLRLCVCVCVCVCSASASASASASRLSLSSACAPVTPSPLNESWPLAAHFAHSRENPTSGRLDLDCPGLVLSGRVFQIKNPLYDWSYPKVGTRLLRPLRSLPRYLFPVPRPCLCLPCPCLLPVHRQARPSSSPARLGSLPSSERRRESVRDSRALVMFS